VRSTSHKVRRLLYYPMDLLVTQELKQVTMKGQKTGGRKLGTPNCITSDLRALLNEMVNRYLANDLELLEPNKRAELLIRLLPFILPTKKDIFEHQQSDMPLIITLDRSEIDS
jgi:hypothetical protein